MTEMQGFFPDTRSRSGKHQFSYPDPNFSFPIPKKCEKLHFIAFFAILQLFLQFREKSKKRYTRNCSLLKLEFLYFVFGAKFSIKIPILIAQPASRF